MINALDDIHSNKPWCWNDGSCVHHATNDKWRGLRTTVTNTASYSMREESILIVFTWTSWRFLLAYTGLLVNATMIDLFACWWLKQNVNGRANTTNNKSWIKSLIVSDYGRIQYYELDPPKIGRAPITSLICDTCRTVSKKPYWELMHPANPNIHCTLRWFALAATCEGYGLSSWIFCSRQNTKLYLPFKFISLLCEVQYPIVLCVVRFCLSRNTYTKFPTKMNCTRPVGQPQVDTRG